MQDIAVASCFCLACNILSLLATFSGTAARISSLRIGAPVLTQFSGVRYFLLRSFRSSLSSPVTEMCSNRLAISLCTEGPYSTFAEGSSPKISSMALSSASAA